MPSRRIVAQGRFVCPLTTTQISADSITGTTIIFISDDGTVAANGNAGNQIIGLGNVDMVDPVYWPMRAGDSLTIDAPRGSDIDISDYYAMSSDALQVLTWMVIG